MRSQSVISNTGRGGRRTAPYAFTEQEVHKAKAAPLYSKNPAKPEADVPRM